MSQQLPSTSSSSSPTGPPSLRTQILDSVESLRIRKTKPDRETIAHYVLKRHEGFNFQQIFTEIENTVDDGQLLKVEYKGTTSYRHPSSFDHKSSPLLTKHSKILNSSKTTRMIMSTMERALAGASGEDKIKWEESGIPLQIILDSLATEDPTRFSPDKVNIALDRELFCSARRIIIVDSKGEHIQPAKGAGAGSVVGNCTGKDVFIRWFNDSSKEAKGEVAEKVEKVTPPPPPPSGGSMTTRRSKRKSPGDVEGEEEVVEEETKQEALEDFEIEAVQGGKGSQKGKKKAEVKVESPKRKAQGEKETKIKFENALSKISFGSPPSTPAKDVKPTRKSTPRGSGVSLATTPPSGASGSSSAASGSRFSARTKRKREVFDPSDYHSTPYETISPPLELPTTSRRAKKSVDEVPKLEPVEKKSPDMGEFKGKANEEISGSGKKRERARKSPSPPRKIKKKAEPKKLQLKAVEKTVQKVQEPSIPEAVASEPEVKIKVEEAPQPLQIPQVQEKLPEEKVEVVMKPEVEIPKEEEDLGKEIEAKDEDVLVKNEIPAVIEKAKDPEPEMTQSEPAREVPEVKVVEESVPPPRHEVKVEEKEETPKEAKEEPPIPMDKTEKLFKPPKKAKLPPKAKLIVKPEPIAKPEPDEAISTSSIEDPPDPSKVQVSSWTPEQVASYFKSKGLGDEGIIFKEQEIDGLALLLLTRQDVIYGLGLRLGPALKVYRITYNLQMAKIFNE